MPEQRDDLIAFGRPLLAHPDVAARMRNDTPLNTPDMAMFCVAGANGYTHYPALTA